MSKHDILESTVVEITNTDNFIIITCQNELFPDDINALLNDEVIINQLLLSLDPFLDDNVVLCVNGRLKRSTINYYEKHPIILPKECHLSHMIIKHYYEEAEHRGRGLTISTIRCNGIYIIDISRLVQVCDMSTPKTRYTDTKDCRYSNRTIRTCCTIHICRN